MPSFRLPLNCVEISKPTSSAVRSSLPETLIATPLKYWEQSWLSIGPLCGWRRWDPGYSRHTNKPSTNWGQIAFFFYIFNILRENGKFELQRFKFLYVYSYYFKLLRALKFKFAVCTQATFSNASMFRSSCVRTVVPQFFRLSELWDFDEPTQWLWILWTQLMRQLAW